MTQIIETLVHDGPPQVCVITVLKDLYDIACEVARLYQVPTRIILTPVDSEVATARTVLAGGVEALIGRGQLVTLLRKETSLPVISIAVSAADILRCLLPFQGQGQVVGVLGFTGFVSGVEEIAALLQVPIYRMDVSSLEQLSDVLQKAKDQGVRHMVGSYGLVCKAKDQGFEGVILRSGREAVVQAFEEAIHIITLRRRWREQSELVRSVFNATQDAIISVDHNGYITCMNANAGEFYGIAPEAGIGRPIQAFLPGLKTSMLLRTVTRDTVGQITVQTGRRTVMVRHSPLYHSEAVTGAVICIQDVTELQRLEQITRQKLHLRQLLAGFCLEDIIGESDGMRALKRMARKYARVDASVLILGETGTGKELFAQGMHACSPRSKGPFVAVNCAALPEQLLESELFGYEEGAFTGARRGGKEGLFELAHGGSIFLDEVGEMSISLQARMLRILQDRMVMRIGGNKVIPVDVRIIAATNLPVEKLMRQDLFREDLFYRLNTLQLSIPPLRRRTSDIPLLVRHFLKKYSYLNPVVQGISRQAEDCLMRSAWPGNVRQLEHVIERAVIMCESNTISLDPQTLGLDEEKEIKEGLLPSPPAQPTPAMQNKIPPSLPSLPPSATQSLRTTQNHMIRKALEEHRYHQGKAAQALGISRSTLWRRMQEMGM